MSAVSARASERLLIGRLAGLLFLVGSLGSIPVNQLFEPAVDPRAHLITGLGVASGLLCFVMPWDRIDERWFHVLPPVAAVEVAITMWGVAPHGNAYMWFLVFIVVFAGYAFESRRAVAAHVGCATAMLSVPLLTAGEGNLENVIAESLVAMPILLVAAGVVVHLRERLTAAIEAVGAEARLDPLTEVGNYRLLDERLRYELTRHRRTGRPLSVVVLDLDNFKAVNDVLGHLAGDQLLREVAAALRTTVREADTVVRQGGDEFCILAPETGTDEAAQLVSRVKHALRGLVAVGEPLSTSCGSATFPDDATSPELLLAQADHEQRRDKAAGRGGRATLRAVR
ncbi:MAG: GGDEF domain-containing protein [Actinomycetota bacterium]|nr:GGDEF domain-containing protein [Actinomycetota bacterium]MDQ5808375.1 GGDEF domain-containing protein [Actinomycetota bacterium]